VQNASVFLIALNSLPHLRTRLNSDIVEMNEVLVRKREDRSLRRTKALRPSAGECTWRLNVGVVKALLARKVKAVVNLEVRVVAILR
jgi:hypothetical protein